MSNEKVRNKKKIIFLISLLVLVIVGGTYAWFTLSQVTGTDSATAKTSEDQINLYISSEGGNDFKNGTEADIIQTSAADREYLMPVSTADLSTFIYSQSGKESKASGFVEDTKGRYYYKGRVYLKAELKGKNAGRKLDLYFDASQEPMAFEDEESPEILNCSRIGLKFDGESPIIFQLSDTHNVDDPYKNIGILDGKEIGDGKVLTKQNGNIVAVNDPSSYYKNYVVDSESETPVIPDKTIFSMEFNRIYAVDVFYYMEGCDSDCTDTVTLQGTTIHLGFFGVLN